MKIEFKVVINGNIDLCLTPEDEFEKQMLTKVFNGDVSIETPPNSNNMIVISNKQKP